MVDNDILDNVYQDTGRLSTWVLRVMVDNDILDNVYQDEEVFSLSFLNSQEEEEEGGN